MNCNDWPHNKYFNLQATELFSFSSSIEAFQPPYISLASQETSLLRRLQGKPSPAEAPPMGKIHPFSKMTITFEQLMRF